MADRAHAGRERDDDLEGAGDDPGGYFGAVGGGRGEPFAEAGASEYLEGATVELARGEARSRPAFAPDDLRSHLPGLEPERHVTDWGRSERVEGWLDRTLGDFLYHYWFRVEVEGIENVPDDGGALLVANHAGTLPPDGLMIAKAVREAHPRSRPVHVATDRSYRDTPWLGMLNAKIGGVPGHPANVHRLLFDERQLVLVFPEGRAGPGKPLKERYRLRRFGAGAFVRSAIRARAPIVPVAVVGSEEAQPVFARVGPLRRLTRLPRIPVTPPVPLPAKFKIRFLEPIDPPDAGTTRGDSLGLAPTLMYDIRALIQENLLEMVSARRSVWLG